MYRVHLDSGANQGETPGIGESPSNQPITGLVIFSKRQALSRAVVVNSNISCGKYLAREGPGSRLGQAVPSLFCQRSKDEGKWRPKFTKCEKINIFEHAAGFCPPVAMAKPKWRQILLSLTAFSNVASKEGKPMSCASSVFIPVKRMGVCNFSPLG